MFDDIKCKYPLPLEGANALSYQTKDTPSQTLDNYEIREDGTLWHEEYDTEDHSEAGKWMKENPGKELPESFGLISLAGCISRVNKRWEQLKITGEVCFYAMYSIKGGLMVNAHARDCWLEWSAYFRAGELKELNLIENRTPETPIFCEQANPEQGASETETMSEPQPSPPANS